MAAVELEKRIGDDLSSTGVIARHFELAGDSFFHRVGQIVYICLLLPHQSYPSPVSVLLYSIFRSELYCTPLQCIQALVHYEMAAVIASRRGAHKESAFSYKKILKLLEKSGNALDGYNSIVKAAEEDSHTPITHIDRVSQETW